MNTTSNMKKPGQLRAIFILNLALVFICFTFYAVARSKGDVAGVPKQMILYTALAYTAIFPLLVIAILKKSLLGVRILNLVTIASSIPASAIIGIVFGLVSLGLSFHKKVKAYFAS